MCDFNNKSISNNLKKSSANGEIKRKNEADLNKLNKTK